MIIISLACTSYFDLKRKCFKAEKYGELTEVRVDALEEFDINQLKKIDKEYSPLFTLRSKQEGGFSDLSNEERKERLKALIDLKPDYIDLEYKRDLSLLPYLKKESPKTKWICSYHDLCYFPKSINSLIEKMKDKKPWKVKIAAASTGLIDSLKMLELMQKHSNFIGIAMGEFGQLSRILGPVFKQPITYASLYKDAQTASGQLSGEELEDVYHYSKLNSKTKLLGIIGKPLSQSPGYLVYNPVFEHESLNSIYVNLELNSSELKEGLTRLKKLGFLGCSVTIPHKEAILPFLNEVDSSQKEIQSINTLLFKKNGIKGKNTDGIGAKKCLEAFGSLEKKKVLILGAGGTAHGIGYVLKNAKAKLIIMNRTNHKAYELAKELDAEFRPFESRSFLKREDYDILVHTTSVGSDNPEDCLLPEEVIYPKKVVLDVVFQQTRLLKVARRKNCDTINGFEFWLKQGEEQFRYWFKEIWPRIPKLMRRYLP